MKMVIGPSEDGFTEVSLADASMDRLAVSTTVATHNIVRMESKVPILLDSTKYEIKVDHVGGAWLMPLD